MVKVVEEVKILAEGGRRPTRIAMIFITVISSISVKSFLQECVERESTFMFII